MVLFSLFLKKILFVRGSQGEKAGSVLLLLGKSTGLCRHVEERAVGQRGEASGRVGLWVASEASLWAARGGQRDPAEKKLQPGAGNHQRGTASLPGFARSQPV